MNILFVGIGGFFGSGIRYLVTRLFDVLMPVFPFGTLICNVVAGFLIGLIIGIERQTGVLPARLKLFLTTGLLGGLSTFSTFSLETMVAIENGKLFIAAGNIILNVSLCLVGVFLGLTLSKVLVIK